MAFKLPSKSPFYKSGPCGGPGQPKCEDELQRMAKKMGVNKSYRKSINVSDVGSMKKPSSLGGGSYMTKNNVNKAIQKETTRRANTIINDPAYKTLTQNKKARPIVEKVDNYINKATTNKGNATSYMIPSAKESKGLLNIGRKYVNSSNIVKDMSFIDKGKALLSGGKLLVKYPNLRKIASKYQK